MNFEFALKDPPQIFGTDVLIPEIIFKNIAPKNIGICFLVILSVKTWTEESS